MRDLIDTLTFNMLIIRFKPSDDQPLSPRIVLANHACANLLGYSEHELIGQPLDLILSTKASSFWQAAVATKTNTDTDSCFGAEIITKHQQIFQARKTNHTLKRFC